MSYKLKAPISRGFERYMFLYSKHNLFLADGGGFEPPEDLHPRRFSRPVQSTTLPPIQNLFTRRSFKPTVLFADVPDGTLLTTRNRANGVDTCSCGLRSQDRCNQPLCHPSKTYSRAAGRCAYSILFFTKRNGKNYCARQKHNSRQ